MQVTKGTWRMREQCVPGSLSSSPTQEPGNEASMSDTVTINADIKKGRPRCYAKSQQDMFWSIPGLISFAWVTRRRGLPPHAQNEDYIHFPQHYSQPQFHEIHFLNLCLCLL